MSEKSLQQPFWRDESDFQQPLHLSTVSLRPIVIVFRILIYLFVTSVVFFLFYETIPLLVWIWALYIVFQFGLSIYLRKRKKLSVLNVTNIQQRAREQSGTSIIGSAIHVAGHPLLEREQAVVLALASEGLKIFTYDDQVPIDIISLNQLVAFQTVVYDDERTPHIDTVDSAAQALQVTFKYPDKEFTCLFRRMRNIRPIDWYHEFQKTRWQQNHQ